LKGSYYIFKEQLLKGSYKTMAVNLATVHLAMKHVASPDFPMDLSKKVYDMSRDTLSPRMKAMMKRWEARKSQAAGATK